MQDRAHGATVYVAINLAFITSAMAAPQIPIWDAGKMTCRQWQHASHSDRRAAENWVFGYLNAYNYFANGLGPYVGQGMTAEQIAGWIDVRCRKNQAATVDLIAYQIGDDFDGQFEDRD